MFVGSPVSVALSFQAIAERLCSHNRKAAIKLDRGTRRGSREKEESAEERERES
jgi:hypothetical protein